MKNAIRFGLLGLVVLTMSACSSDDGSSSDAGGDPGILAATICTEQIDCGYQLADQDDCAQMFEAFMTADQLADCEACVTAEECDTEQDVCTTVCSAM